jgi:hypothetical protein
MAKVHDRILEIAITCDESADTVLATAVNYYRTRADLDATDPKALTYTAGSAAGTHEIEMGEITPPPTHIRITSTFQA